MKSILNEIRESIDGYGRLHLIARKDLQNIKLQYHINFDGILGPSDTISISKWVEKMKTENDTTVILYKPQDVVDNNYPNLLKEDFLLAIMNNSQQEMFKLYGNDVICIDFTHGMNAYGFDLATIVVLDDRREAFPSCFIISNRQDSRALSTAFKAVREICGNVKPNAFMSDEAESFYNAW